MAKAQILKELIHKLNTNVSQFEKKIDSGTSTISKAISRNSELKMDIVEKIVQAYPQVSRKWLLTAEEPMLVDPKTQSKKPTGEDIRLRKALGDEEDEQGLVYVPIAAQAGYSRNYSDPLYINQLNRLYIPGLPYKGDKYRYFDVEGDSMVPTIEDGMQVIGELVMPEDWQFVHDYYIYVIVLQNMITIKRVFKKGDNKLVIISDNDLYPQQLIDMANVKEMWYVKRILDWRMPPPKEIKITV